MLLDDIENVFRSNCELAFARSRENQRVLWIEPMMYDLGLDGVGVRRESRIFHQDFEARLRRLVKRGHHQVKVHCEAIHADHFDWLRANEPRGRLAESFVIRIPRCSRRVMRIDAESCPIVEFLLDDLPRGFRHRTKRIPGEIDQRLAVFAER